MSQYHVDLPNAEDSEISPSIASMLFSFHQGMKNISYVCVGTPTIYSKCEITFPCLYDSLVLYSG